MGTVAGIPVDPITGEPRTAEGLLALRKQQEEEREAKKERETGFDPLRAAGLAAGASLLRNSGWRRTPMTLGEQIGHAIPAGMEAYYNQDALNQNEQQALYDRQQAEQTALDEKQQTEADLKEERDRAEDFKMMVIDGKFGSKMTNFLLQRYRDNPEKALAALQAKLLEKKTAGKDQYKILTPEEAKAAGVKDWETRTFQQNQTTKKIEEFNYSDIKEKDKVIDYTAAASNIFDQFSGATNPDGTSKYNQEKLQAALSHPDPEQRYKNLETFMNSVDSQAYKEFVAVGGLKLREASLEQTKDEYANEQKKYIKREQVRLADNARKMNWGESRVMMEEQAHDRKIRQMDKNWEDGQKKNLVSAKEWITENGGELPEGVAFVERRADGKMGKLINNDWTTYTAPLNTGAKTEVSDEINRLFTKYSDKFNPEDIDEIKGLLFGDDPMEALKKAHARLKDKGEKGIQAPASILKKYQSDMGVRRAAEEALAMMNDPKQMAIIEKEVGFFYGQVTEKAKHPLFQKFKAIATMAALTKRHELIGSQMTDGELKFTEPMFPSNKDTKQSLMIKLQTMLTDANFNISLTRKMFSAEAGYNDKVWGDDATKPTTAADLE